MGRCLFLAACSYMKVCLGGPTPADYEALIAERELLKRELSDARQQIDELQGKVWCGALIFMGAAIQWHSTRPTQGAAAWC